jgi:hypothetical protein
MSLSDKIKNFIQPKVDTKRLKISLGNDTSIDDDDIVVESVESSNSHEFANNNNVNEDNTHEESSLPNNNDIKNIVEEVNKTSFFNSQNETPNQSDITLPPLDDEASLQQLLDAIATEIINDTERRLSLAEQLALRLRSYLGITKENNSKEVADKKLLSFFKDLKNKLNNMGDVL